MSKLFNAMWGEGYLYPDSKAVTLADITEANGYDEQAILIVKALRVGDTADLSDPSGHHTIKRLK